MAQSIDVDLINAFWHAVKESLEVMGGMKVKRRRVFIRPDNAMQGDFYAVIGLADGMVGNVAVCFSREMAIGVIEHLFGEHTEEESMLSDGVGEIANLTAGGGRKQLYDLGHRFEISPPTILINHSPDELLVYNPAGTVCVVIECGVSGFSEEQVFTIEIALQTEETAHIQRRKQVGE